MFHSVSAFCNAGFSLYSDSLETSGNPAVLVVVGSLIILGGLSFSAIFDLLDRISPNSAVRSRPLKVNTVITSYSIHYTKLYDGTAVGTGSPDRALGRDLEQPRSDPQWRMTDAHDVVRTDLRTGAFIA